MERLRRAGDHHLGAELLGLGVGAIRELLPGDAEREAQVVLDARARAGLPAGGAGVEHQHVEAFRGAVDRGGQAGGPGADDDDVAHVPDVDGDVETQTVGDALVVGVAQHGVTATDEHRHLVGRDVETVEQGLHVAVAVEIEVGAGVVVAGQELAHPQGASGVGRADQHHVAEPLRHQLETAIDEGSHQ